MFSKNSKITFKIRGTKWRREHDRKIRRTDARNPDYNANI